MFGKPLTTVSLSFSILLRAAALCVIGSVAVVGLLTGCQQEGLKPTTPQLKVQTDLLTQIRSAGAIIVATRRSPTTYYIDADGPAGYEYELAQAFADELGVQLQIKAADSMSELFAMIDSGAAHLGAAGLTATESRRNHYDFSTAYQTASELVIYRTGQRRPRKIEDLVGGDLIIAADSSHADTLRDRRHLVTGLAWMESPVVHTLELLEQVQVGEIDYTIVDSNSYLTAHGLFPQLRVGFEITAPRPVAWVVSKQARSSSLLELTNTFLARQEQRGALADLNERYYGHTPEINSRGLHTFTRFMDQRLPRYEKLIQQIAAEEDVDWRLLAAISYQESHWNPNATSPTGVRGMMMLTQPTANEMGVNNRIDPEQSLRGGARYFKKIMARIPERICEPDRTWLALAAYNVGLGHLEDARVITQKQGGNPDRWLDVARHLPLLRKKQWYSQTRYGYARGEEPVGYVRNIRRYYNILSMNELARSLPRADTLLVSLVETGTDVSVPELVL